VAEIVLHALDGVDPPVPARASGDPQALKELAAGLPDGPATAEAVALRLRRDGEEPVWGAPVQAESRGAFLHLCRGRGASSVEVIRADPSLLTGMQIGRWFDSYARRRLTRRAALTARLPPSLLRANAAEAAFWRGVRGKATAREWERLTRSSYVVLYYHRIAGDRKPGQERIDISPATFERHMSWLRRLGLRPLGADELVAFHRDPEATLPRRSVLLTADDAFRDAVLALRRYANLRPIVFASTAVVGGDAPWEWAGREPIASWAELEQLCAEGGEVGSHARTHVPLPELDPEAVAVELTESRRELQQHLSRPAPLLAYPHGRNDQATRRAAAIAGYHAAFTTEAGRNGAGTDPYALRRIGPKEWDGAAAFLWQALTGEAVPWSIERRRRRRGG
jgi:peptidoglycan/xylan/chitin deacetylase (PgdA/CDA1 family)